MADRPIRTEIRFSLVLYGGISLAVYMSGIVQEILALVRASQALRRLEANPHDPWATRYRGENPYCDLLEEAGVWATVDVITGASAGGLNGLLLSKALAVGAERLVGIEELWIKEGSIAALAAHDLEPRSGISGDYLRERLTNALQRLDEHSIPHLAAMGPNFDLHMAATDVHGHQWQREDHFGRPISGKTHTHFFHFKHRVKSAGPTPSDFRRPPSQTQRLNQFLATVGQASAAFPVAFPAVPIKRSEARTLGLRCLREYDQDPTAETVYFMDGGLLANKPFSPILDEIASRQSRGPVVRVIAYVDPNPNSNATERQEPTPLETGLGAVAIMGAQDILDELMTLQQINQNRALLHGLLLDLERRMVQEGLVKHRPAAGGQLAAIALMEAPAMAPETDEDPPVPPEIGVVLEHPARNPRATPPPLDEAYSTRRLQGARAYLSQVVRACDPQATEAEVEAIVAEIGFPPDGMVDLTLLEPLDLPFRQRRLFFLADRLTRHMPQGAYPAQTEALTQLWKLLWEAVDLALSFRVGLPARVKDRDRGALSSLLRRELFDLDGRVSGLIAQALDMATKALPLQDAAGVPMATVQLPQSRPTFLTADYLATLWERYLPFDHLLLPVHAERKSLETSPVLLSRFAPESVDWARTGLDPAQKLSGNGLGPFAAFCTAEGRARDIAWGRLDGAAHLFQAISRAAGPSVELTAPSYHLLLTRRREQILRERFPDAFTEPVPAAERERHLQGIVQERLDGEQPTPAEVIPAAVRIAVNLVEALQRPASDSPLARVGRRISRPLTLALPWARRFLGAANVGSRAMRSPLAPLILGAMGAAGALLLLLQVLGLITFSPVGLLLPWALIGPGALWLLMREGLSLLVIGAALIIIPLSLALLQAVGPLQPVLPYSGILALGLTCLQVGVLAVYALSRRKQKRAKERRRAA